MAERLQRCWHKHLGGPGQSITGRGSFPPSAAPPSRITPKLLRPLEGTASPAAARYPARAALLLTRDLNTPYLCFSNVNGEGSSLSPGNTTSESPCSKPSAAAAAAKPGSPAALGRFYISSHWQVRWEQLCELLLRGCCRLSPRVAHTPVQRPARTCLGSAWGSDAGPPGSPGVLCPMYPAVTAQEGLRQTHIAQRGGVQVWQALTPLLGEKSRVVQKHKKEEEPVVPWEISCAVLPQMWWHWLSPVLALAWPDTAVPVPTPLWRAAGEAPISAVPFLSIPGQKPSASISVATGETHTFAAQREVLLLHPSLFWLPPVFV